MGMGFDRARVARAASRNVSALGIDGHRNPVFEALISADKKGKVIFNTNTSSTVQDFSFRTWFREAIAGKSFVSKVYISAITSKLIVTLAVPIKNPTGEVAGTLCGGLMLE